MMFNRFFTTLSPAHKGMLYSLMGYTGFAMSDVSVKILGARYTIYQILAIDFMLAAALLYGFTTIKKYIKNTRPHLPSPQRGEGCVALEALPLRRSWVGGQDLFKTNKLKLHILRGALNFAVGTLFVIGLIALPMATVYTLIFTTPFYAVIITAILYKEKMRAHRWAAIGVGFIGILIVVRPSIEGIDLVMLAPLAASFFGALLFVLAKSMHGESDFTMGFYPTFVAGILCAPLAAYHGFAMPTASDLIFFLICGVGINIGIILVSKAYTVAESATVAPFHYSQILWGILFGYFVFHELPDIYTFIGAGIIIASGLFLVLKERGAVEGAA